MMQGLSHAEAKRRQDEYGPNVLRAEKGHPIIKIFLSQFTDLMVMILIVSAGIAIGLGLYHGDHVETLDGYVIIGIIIVNAAIGFFQEYRSEKALEALKKLIAPHAIVIREGKKMQIKAQEIVPGDLVVLNAGDKIVADGVLIEDSAFAADESSLTGESVPVYKSLSDMVFMGTSVARGTATMEVRTIGMSTEFGRIAHLTTETVRDSSPLQKELHHIGIFVTKVTILLTVILIAVGVIVQGQHFLDALLFSVSVAVAAVPEGLPATITVALALGVQTMVRKNALVKKLSSIETLGSTTVICSDKTGTLTKNEMTVVRLLLGADQVVDVSGVGYDPSKGAIGKSKAQNSKSKIISNDQNSNLQKIGLISTYCTESELQKKGKTYHVLGDPTEGALLTLAMKGMKDSEDVKDMKVVGKIPFDSERKLMSVLMKGSKGSEELLTKGAPDELLKRCTHLLKNGKVQKLTPALRRKIVEHNQTMAHQALRVIGFAFRTVGTGHALSVKNSEKNLIFVGLAGMIDPPREEVKEAVRMCHQAGIRTIIITGDNGLTAKAIARQIGMANQETPVILGTELDEMTDRELDKLLSFRAQSRNRLPVRDSSASVGMTTTHSLIFSRVSPEHKRRIVDRLKAMGEVVAVTGDGVNDAPALKRADLGIAMGISGTEVSRETANMVLLDDSFASIVTAVREGRKIYANLKKFIWFMFSTNIGELVTIFAAILLGFPAPLTALLILAVNVGTDIFPGIALGVDHAEPNVMEKPPRDRDMRIMNPAFVRHFLIIGLLIGAITLAAYYWKLSSLGWSYGEKLSPLDPRLLTASTLAFAVLVIIQLFNAFNARSIEFSVFRLRVLYELWGAVLLSVLMVVAIVYLPSLQTLFHTQPLTLNDWLVVLGAGVLVLGVEEIRKFFIYRKPPFLRVPCDTREIDRT